MKNRVLLVLLAVMLALSVGLSGCGGEPASETTKYTLTVASTEGGSVTSPGEPGPYTYDEGEVVNLVAEADEDYRFVSWTGDVDAIADVNTASTTITMDSHCSITANFAYGPAIPPKNADTFVQMTTADIDSLDPAWGYDYASWEQVGYIYETLVFYDGEKIDQFIPVLATEWELLADNVTYRFKIRDGVRFHEGGILTPSDVEYSFERAMVQDREISPVWMFYTSLLGLGPREYQSVSSRDAEGNIQVTFDQIDNAVEVEGDWVVLHLSDRAWRLPFLQILCSPWASIVDKEWCVAHGEWDGTEETWEEYNNPYREDSYLYDHTNGTGPWKLEEWDPSVQIILVRNEEYWREPAAFERVITQFVEDWATRKDALLTGDADFVYVPLTSIGELEGIADLNAYKYLPEPMTYAFFFNFNIASDSEYIGSGALDGGGIPTDFFTNIDVRKGFCYAFDYDTYIDDGWLGEAQQLGSPVCEGLPYFNPDASMYSLDLAKAEEHLRAAWDGEVWEKGFRFTLLYNPGSLYRETACKILAENLATINPKFKVSIQPVDWPTYVRPGLADDLLPMFMIGLPPDYLHPDNFVVFYMTTYSTLCKLQGYGYPELDDLVEDAFRELDPSVQRDLYYGLQERYYEDAPSLGMIQRLETRCFTKYIEGFYFNPWLFGQAGPLYYMNKSES